MLCPPSSSVTHPKTELALAEFSYAYIWRDGCAFLAQKINLAYAKTNVTTRELSSVRKLRYEHTLIIVGFYRDSSDSHWAGTPLHFTFNQTQLKLIFSMSVGWS